MITKNCNLDVTWPSSCPYASNVKTSRDNPKCLGRILDQEWKQLCSKSFISAANLLVEVIF